MERVVLEKAWAESFDFPNASVAAKVMVLSRLPAQKLAADVYGAAMEMRSEGINWYGSDFEDELLDVVSRGDAAISNPDVHISLAEYREIDMLRKETEKSLDETLSEAKGKSDAVNDNGTKSDVEIEKD